MSAPLSLDSEPQTLDQQHRASVQTLVQSHGDRMVTLVDKSGTARFPLSIRALSLSGLVTTSLLSDVNATELPLAQVDAKVLGLVAEYLARHNGVNVGVPDKPLRSRDMKDVVKVAPDAPFIDTVGTDRQVLYGVVLAANYLDIPSLLGLGCAKIASLVKEVPLEKVKEVLMPNGTTKKRKETADKESDEEQKSNAN